MQAFLNAYLDLELTLDLDFVVKLVDAWFNCMIMPLRAFVALALFYTFLYLFSESI